MLKFTLTVFLLVVARNGVWSLTDNELQYFKARTPFLEKNTQVQGVVSAKVDPKDGKVLILQSNGIPDHDTGTFPGQGNPNSITVQTYNWRVPMHPSMQTSSSTSCLPMGPIGMATNGVAIYNPFTSTCCDAGAVELDLFDMCAAHPAPSGQYHYHIFPKCLKDSGDYNNTIFGVAFDGFPIYGPEDENGNKLSKNDLDECNGRHDSAGNYRYHITDEYPYFMGCYKGRVRKDVGDVGSLDNCQCLTPVEVCEEFDNGPPPRSMQNNNNDNDDGNGSGMTSMSLTMFMLATFISIFGNLFA